MIVDISKKSVKKIRELIVFTAFLVVALWKFNVVLDVLKAIWGIVFPFVLGGAIAFVTNVPMSFLEKKIFGRVKKENKIVVKLARPISLLLTVVLVVGVISLVMFGVIPQLTRTMGTLMTSIADFIPHMQSWIREFFHNNQEIMNLVDQIEFDPDQAIKWGISLLGKGAGNMMNTTMSAVGSIVSGLATFFIAFSFACYVLFQKEKLSVPSFGFTFNYFTQSIQNLTANKQIIPLSNFYDIPLWYPLTKEDSAVWGAYGKNGFDLENKIFSTGIHYAWQLKKECYSSADAANLPAYSPNTAQSQWKSGKTAFWYESTHIVDH